MKLPEKAPNWLQIISAKELGVAFSTVSRWFNGKTVPSKIQQYHVEKYLTQKKIILPAKSAKEVK